MSELSAKYTLDGQQAIDTLQKTTKEVAKHKRELDALSKQTKQWSRDSNTATGAARTFIDALKKDNVQGMGIAIKGMSSQLLKFTGVGAGAVTALELFNKTINSSQAATDEFGRIQTSVTTVVDNFFQSLASGDFSPFLNGLDNMISKARDAYDALDTLWNMQQSFDVKNARLNLKFNQNTIEMRKLKGSKNPADQARYNELKKENQGIIKQQTTDATKMAQQAFKALRTNLGKDTGLNASIFTDNVISKVFEADINGIGNSYKKQYKNYLAEKEKLDRQAEKKEGSYFMGKTGVNYQNDLFKLQKKNAEAIAYNQRLLRDSDEEYKTQVDLLKQAYSYSQGALTNQSKMVRYDKETPIKTGGSTSGGTGGSKNNTNYPEGSIAYYESIISSLNNEIKLQVDDAEIVRLEKELAEAKRLKEYLENSSFRARQQELKDNIQITGLGSLSTPFSEGVNPLNDSLKKIREDIQNNPIEVKIDVQKSIDKLGTLGDAFSDLGIIMSSLGSLTDDVGVNIAGIIAQAVANYILGWTEATKSAAAIGGFLGWGAFSLSTGAQMLAMVAQIKAAGAYADGGIIQGATTIGDYNIARVNAGEMILNQRQQSNLFDMINDGVSNNAGMIVSEVKIKGSDLYLALKNYGSTRQVLGKNIGIK